MTDTQNGAANPAGMQQAELMGQERFAADLDQRLRNFLGDRPQSSGQPSGQDGDRQAHSPECTQFTPAGAMSRAISGAILGSCVRFGWLSRSPRLLPLRLLSVRRSGTRLTAR